MKSIIKQAIINWDKKNISSLEEEDIESLSKTIIRKLNQKLKTIKKVGERK